jgi:hypothetical protein
VCLAKRDSDPQLRENEAVSSNVDILLTKINCVKPKDAQIARL